MKNTTHIGPLFLATPSLPLRIQSRLFLVAAAILLLLSAARGNAIGIASTWSSNPTSGNWNSNTNWSPALAPNGPSDTAIFASSSKTGVSLSANTEVDTIMFNSGASAFTITASPAFTLTIDGAGITNNSGITQNFVTAVIKDLNGFVDTGTILFTNSATAGSMTAFTNNGGTADGFGGVGDGGGTFFENSSTAGSGTFTNDGGVSSGGGGGSTQFFNTSTAGSGTFTNKAGTDSNTLGGSTQFFDTSTGSSGTFTNNGSTIFGAFGGETVFNGSSTAGSGTFTTNGGTVNSVGAGAETVFLDTSTASNGTFTNNGSAVSGAGGGETDFLNSATASNGTFTNNGGAVSGANGGGTVFFQQSTAGNGTLIANGGVSGGGGGAIFFENDSLGGTSRVEVFGNGKLDISAHNAPGLTIGSIEGTGNVFLGARNLTVGSNNLSKTSSGVIQDGGIGGGTGGSLTKIGKGKLSVTNANTYTGGTAVTKGTLLVKNKTGSGTGTGAVQVNAGTLGGVGMINGAVTVGTGTSSGAILLAGNSATSPGTLTVNNTLTFQSLSTYQCVLNRTKAKASEVSALGVTIDSNVPFTFVDTGTGTLTVGTVFTVINNTSANPIFGTFSNLANGSTFASNGNNFKVSYTGGTGNDLTLKVVP